MSYKGLIRPSIDMVKGSDYFTRKYGLYTGADYGSVDVATARAYAMDPGFTPASIEGLKIWLDAAVGTYQESTMDTAAAADGDPVGAWVSIVGDHAFIQATSDSRPALKLAANGINGRPVVRADGTADHLKIADGSILGASSGSVFAVFSVTDATPAAGSALITSSDEASTTRHWRIFACSTTSRLALEQRNNDTADTMLGNAAAIAASTNYIGRWGSTDTAFVMGLNGNPQTISVAAGANNGDWTTEATARDNVVIFALQNSGGVANYMGGDLAELLVYEPVISDAAKAAIEQYLAAKYGITLA